MGLIPYAGYDPTEGSVERAHEQDRCGRGHLRTAANTYWASHGGKRWRVCKLCRALNQRQRYSDTKHNGEANADGG